MNGAARIYSIDIGETGDDFAALSKRFPGQLFALQADVTKEASISTAVDKIVEEAGALHGMVVNAGRTNHKSALDFTTEEIESLFSVNVGHICLCFPFTPLGCWSWLTHRNGSAIWSILHGQMCRPSIHQAWHQGGDRLYCLHGLLPPQQGTSKLLTCFTI